VRSMKSALVAAPNEYGLVIFRGAFFERFSGTISCAFFERFSGTIRCAFFERFSGTIGMRFLNVSLALKYLYTGASLEYNTMRKVQKPHKNQHQKPVSLM